MVDPNVTLRTNNGNITLWADSDGDSSGWIGMQAGVTINSANGSTTQSTGGGRITLAGGTTTDSDGLPTGYAYAASTVGLWGDHKPGGVQLGAYNYNTGGGYANDIKLYSGGGNIVIKGKAADEAPGVAWYGGNTGTQVVDAGNGTITIDGQGVGTGHGVEFTYYGGTASPTLRSGSNAATAISISGTAIGYAGYQGTATLQATGTGNIVVSGTAAGAYGSVVAGSLNASATGGTVSILGTGGTGIVIGGTITGLNPILIRSTRGIELNSATLGNNNGASVVLWSRYNNEGADGRIKLSGTTINTGGGHVWMGGGNTATSTWNGLTVGRGDAASWSGDTVALYALNSNITTGGGNVSLSGLGWYTGTTWISYSGGTKIDKSTINTGVGKIDLTGKVWGKYYNGGYGLELSGGQLVTTSGAITLRGEVTSTDPVGLDGSQRVLATYIHDQSLVHSTSGAINIYGVSTANAWVSAGLWFGTNAFSTDGNVSNSASVANGFSSAIVSDSGSVLLDGRVSATRTDGWTHAVVFLSRASDRSLIKTNTGNITIKGDANTPKGDSTGLVMQIESATSGFSFLSTSGDIYMQAFQQARSTATYNNAIRFGPGASSGSIRFGAATDSSTYTGRLTVEGDSILNADSGVSGAVKAYGTNVVSFSSSGATSTKDFTLGTMWDFGTQHSSLSIGKPTENKNIILEADLFAAGPITVYGGDITLRRDMTSTQLGAPIQLIALGSIKGDTRQKTIRTNAGEVILAADSDGNGSGDIRIFIGLAIDTRRHIFSVSGYAGYNTTEASKLKYVRYFYLLVQE